MCGIFGYLGESGKIASALRSMSDALRHRGPDDEGFLAFQGGTAVPFVGEDTRSATISDREPVKGTRGHLRCGDRLDSHTWAIGHRRLAILDRSTAGHQPMSAEGGKLWIAFNGEVYNFVELREELEGLGARFVTGTDTEVVLAAYARWGTACLQRFRGMWAIAIVDATSGELLLMRDPFGIKPLYYYASESWVAFASEIKAFVALDGWSARASPARVTDFLLYEQTDHDVECMFEGVRQLGAGCLLRLPLRASPRTQAQHTQERWYRLSEASSAIVGRNLDIRELLDESVGLHLRSDVPVGSCLSGGIDSSSIVALAANRIRQMGSLRELRTVTASAEDVRIDETRFAAIAANASGAVMSTVCPSADMLLQDLDKLVWHQDEPFSSSSIFVQWSVFRKARELGLTVMLDGQGADEAFGGYRGFLGAFLAEELQRHGPRGWLRAVREIRAGTGIPAHRSLAYTLSYTNPGFRHILGRIDGRSFAERSWLSRRFRSIADSSLEPRLLGNWSSFASMSIDMIERSSLPMLLRSEDRNSIAFTTEPRVPFVDRRVMEAAIALPSVRKIGSGIQKHALRVAMRGLVPDEILDRKEKIGFLGSEEIWMTRTHREQFRSLLSEAVQAMDGIISPGILDEFDAVSDGRKRFDYRYWRVICLDRWRRQFDVDLLLP